MEFKRLSDVEVVAEPTETANVLIEEDGVIKKAPKTAIGGGGGYDLVIKHDEDTGNCAIAQGSYEAVAAKLDNGDIPDVRIVRYWSSNSDPSWHSVNCLSISYGGDEKLAISANYGAGDSLNWVNYWVTSDNAVNCTYPD